MILVVAYEVEQAQKGKTVSFDRLELRHFTQECKAMYFGEDIGTWRRKSYPWLNRGKSWFGPDPTAERRNENQVLSSSLSRAFKRLREKGYLKENRYRVMLTKKGRSTIEIFQEAMRKDLRKKEKRDITG